MRKEAGIILFCLSATVLLFVYFLSVPLFGDTLGYGLKTVRWISENSFSPLPAGQGRGEQAMGHPTFFFWLWALLAGVLGHTSAVARFLPAVFTFFSLWGMYRLGSQLSDRLTGWFCTLALLASPLFLIQSMRPMPESAVVAAVVWSIYFYTRGRYTSAAVLCALGVVFREQAIFLAASYFFAEITETGFRKPRRLLLFLAPGLVVVVTGLINLAVNGYFFFPTYMGQGSELVQGWFRERLRFFSAHLLAEDFRWLAVTAALAGMVKGRSKDTWSVPMMLVLLFPALLGPPERLLFVALAFCVVILHLIRERLYNTKLTWVFILFPALIVAFHVLIVLVSPDSALNLFRYLLSVYPAVLVSVLVMMRRYLGRNAAAVLSSVFIISTASANRAIHYPWQPDTSLAWAEVMRDYGEACRFAASLEDTVLVPDLCDLYFTSPECGVLDSQVPVRNIIEGGKLEEGIEYTMVTESSINGEEDLDITRELIPEGSELVRLDSPSWNYGPSSINIYRVVPR
ncbi:hypothetical protein CSA37_09385 [Candidatus Fermentibacteria bacterium]|nr:MAG: hypothetical protein CSA37_09385 [Candidatus Fermentibacteria bacterium]